VYAQNNVYLNFEGTWKLDSVSIVKIFGNNDTIPVEISTVKDDPFLTVFGLLEFTKTKTVTSPDFTCQCSGKYSLDEHILKITFPYAHSVLMNYQLTDGKLYLKREVSLAGCTFTYQIVTAYKKKTNLLE
jgi:hypothetical protein